MKKRIVALLLCCVMLLTLSPSLIASASADDENTVIEQTEEPKNEEPKNEEPKNEEPKTEEPKTEEPKTEEPKTEEPKTEEPKTEEPKTEEPADPEAPTAPEEPVVPEEGEETGDGIISFTNVAPLVSGAAPMLKTMRAAVQANDKTTGSGVELKKSVTEAKDGEYKITLEAYATGSSEMSSTSTPVDIVLVLDVSGSMKDDFGKGKAKTKKIAALKNSVNNFIDSVHDKSPDSKIAIVKFAEDSYYNNDGNHLAEGNNRNIIGYNYTEVLKNFQPMTETNASAFKTAVNGLQQGGATAADYGMDLAKALLNQNDIKTDGRAKVVVMFTDGEPNHLNGFSNLVANSAISTSKSIKDMGATVYTIGIFNNANGTPITSEKQWKDLNNTNKYMHLVSSNYPDASGWNGGKYPGSPSVLPNSSDPNSSYFLSPRDADALDKVFQAIANEAISGVNQALDSTAYIQDTVTEYFDVPTGTKAIQYFTADCTGKDANGNLTFGNRTTASGVSGNFTGKTLTVSGFDFKENWCGSKTDLDGKVTYQGKKLIIEFTVKVRDGFLGGNDVPTNVGKTDGIYDKDGKLVDKFPQPAGVDVKIPDVTVSAVDKNVYLTQMPTDAQLKEDAAATCNGVNLLNESAYTGTNAWKAKFVTISTTTAIEHANFDATADGTYTLTAKVEPTKTGTATAKSASATGKINVFKPEVTFKDSEVYYGDTAPEYASNLVGTVWKHGSTEADVSKMGKAPELTWTYTPEAGKITNNTIDSTEDIKVTATVKIGTRGVTEYTDFLHQNCNPTCSWTTPTAKGDPAFLLHVKTCQLIITKSYVNQMDPNQSAVFVVTGPNGTFTFEVVIHGTGSVTINGLPVGSYTVTEKNTWTWRYTDTTEQTVTLAKNDTTKTVSFENTNPNPYWLTGGTWCDNRWIDGSKKVPTPASN